MIGVFELLVIGALVLLMIFVVPDRIPKIVKAVKQAKEEFKDAESG
ncbi:MAG: hypothetical protein QXH59_09655 [Candidatus Caldarchaeum sp.]